MPGEGAQQGSVCLAWMLWPVYMVGVVPEITAEGLAGPTLLAWVLC